MRWSLGAVPAVQHPCWCSIPRISSVDIAGVERLLPLRGRLRWCASTRLAEYQRSDCVPLDWLIPLPLVSFPYDGFRALIALVWAVRVVRSGPLNHGCLGKPRNVNTPLAVGRFGPSHIPWYPFRTIGIGGWNRCYGTGRTHPVERIEHGPGHNGAVRRDITEAGDTP